MDTESIMTIISALIASGILVAGLNYFKERKTLAVQARVAIKTEEHQVGLAGVQELEAKLGYLNRVIAVLEQHNTRLEGDLDQAYEMNSRLQRQIREQGVTINDQQLQIDKLGLLVRRLAREQGLNPEEIL